MASRHESASDSLSVPEQFWDDLKVKDINRLCTRALARQHGPDQLALSFLNRDILVDISHKSIREMWHGKWREVDVQLLRLLVLVYLLNVTDASLTREKISVRDLKDAQFFQGPHTLKTKPLLDVFGRNHAGFIHAAERIGGSTIDMADAAFRFLPFPKIPLYYLLWDGDDEFAADLNILFDRSIEQHFNADAIWGLVNLVSDMLLLHKKGK